MPKTLESKDSFLPPLWMLSIIGAVFFVWAIYELKELVVLLVVSYAIAYIIHPALTWLESKKIPRQYGVLIITFVLLLFIILSIVSAVPTLIDEFQNISKNFPVYLAKAKGQLQPLFAAIKKYLPQNQNVEPNLSSPIGIVSSLASPDALNSLFAGMFATLLSGYSLTLTIVNLLLLPFIVYYISVDLELFHSTILGMFPRSTQPRVKSFFLEINQYVSAFVRGQLIVCSVLFVLYAIGLGFLGVELWFLLAVITGFGNLIPYVGFLTGIVLSSIMSLVTFGDFSHLIQVIVLYAVVQSMEGLLITPKIIGTSVGFSPLIIIIAIFIGGQAFGLLGIFLAVPGAAIIRVAGKHLHHWVLEKSKA
jgi:predicted PurR-regulated permease PerM